jgi:hypothetical protein
LVKAVAIWQKEAIKQLSIEKGLSLKRKLPGIKQLGKTNYKLTEGSYKAAW